MSFTTAQKHNAIYHLGYPLTEWTISFIGGRMDRVSSLSASVETTIINILTQLDAINTQRNTYLAADSGTQVKTDGKVYFQSQAILEINNSYRYYQTQLMHLLDLTSFKSQSQVTRS